MINPFTKDSSNMLNIATGETATAAIKKNLGNVEHIGKTELKKCLNDNSKKDKKVKLHTFEELHTKQKQTPLLKQKEQLVCKS